MVKKGKNFTILGDSIIGGIKRNEMNKHSKGNIHQKTFRRVIFQYTEKILSPFLCGYRKGF